MRNKKRPRFAWMRGWRIGRRLRRLRPWRDCTDCGFLSYAGREATAEERAQLYTKGQLGGYPGNVHQWVCARKIWDWRLHYAEACWDAILGEALHDRRLCPGFLRHSPGRSPKDHFKLESDRQEFRRRLLLGVLPLLYAALGAVVGWLLTK